MCLSLKDSYRKDTYDLTQLVIGRTVEILQPANTTLSYSSRGYETIVVHLGTKTLRKCVMHLACIIILCRWSPSILMIITSSYAITQPFQRIIFYLIAAQLSLSYDFCNANVNENWRPFLARVALRLLLGERSSSHNFIFIMHWIMASLAYLSSCVLTQKTAC